MKVTFPGCRPGGHLFILLTVYLVIIPLEMVNSDHSTLCINFPHIRYKNKYLKTLGMEKFPQNPNLWKWFQEKIIAGRVDIANSDNYKQRIALTPTTYYPRGGLRVYNIKNVNTQRALHGWYRLEFWMTTNSAKSDLQESLKLLIIYVEDSRSRRQTIGEFSLHFPTDHNSCPPTDATKYMLLSCGGASRAEPLVSNVILYVRNSPKDASNGTFFPAETDGIQVVPDLTGKHSLNFYVRIPVQDCNQHQRFIFKAKMIIDGTVFTGADGFDSKNLDLFRTSYTILSIGRDRGKVPGASDAIPSRSQSKHLDCSQHFDITDPTSFPWFARVDETYDRRYEEGVGESTTYYTTKTHGCQGQLFRGRCFHNWFTLASTYNSYVGLLNHQNVAEENQIPLCDTQQYSQGFTGEGDTFYNGDFYQRPTKYNNKEVEFPTTHDYLRNHAASCNTTYNGDPSCNVTKLVIDVKRKRRSLREMRGRSAHFRMRQLRLLGFNSSLNHFFECDPDDSGKTKYSGNNCTNVKDDVTGVGFHTKGFHRLLWGLRKGHAVLMAISFLFVLPVNLFVTRYFKESFMNKRVLFSRIWYQVHVHGTFLLAVLMTASLGIIYISKFYLGSSLTGAAKVHAALGWIAFIIFILLTALGGFRCYEDPLRKISIGIHWGFGLLFYLLMVAEMCTAVFIPGNGVASNDPSMCEFDISSKGCGDRKSTISSGAFLHIFAWLGIEAIMHVIMIFFIILSDKQMAVVKTRIFFPVLIPVLKEHSPVNAFGHSIRLILLCVYAFLALCSTSMYIIAYITHTYSTLKGLGPMEATHFQDPDGKLTILTTLAEV